MLAENKHKKCQLELRVLRWARSGVIQKSICITASVNPEALKLKKQPPEVSNKKVLLKILQNWQKSTSVRVRHGFSTVSSMKFLRTLFYWTYPGDYFWRKDLMVKNFYSASLIFLNSQLYHAPSEWWILFWCNEEHFLIKKRLLNFK